MKSQNLSFKIPLGHASPVLPGDSRPRELPEPHFCSSTGCLSFPPEGSAVAEGRRVKKQESFGSRRRLGGRCWQWCKWLAVGREPGSESRPRLPAEVLGRLEHAGAGGPGSPSSRHPRAPSLFEWCFGNISKRFSNIVPTRSPSPGSRCPCGKVLAPNPAKLLLTCVLCALQTFHSAVAGSARIPC